ncbi:helix-turn-helix domain-containing protein [Sporichthya brevicatena]|uniref:Helix-turn-helix domain-containing protein n=1 Tax=Sporichthya brevicatena TaxID=171442 RepID=A0ABP3RLD8_9ACTN
MTDVPPPTQKRLDSESVRALAHPLRNRILGALRSHGPATATGLAARLGTNSGTTSYHLRKLAEIGMVSEVPDSGDGRDRWWRAVHEFTSWSSSEFRDDPDARAAADWLVGYHLRTNTDKTQAWLDVHNDWPRPWLEISDLSDYRLYLTVDQTKAILAELHEVVLRYRALGESARAAGEPVIDVNDPPADGAGLAPVAAILHVHPDVSG